MGATTATTNTVKTTTVKFNPPILSKLDRMKTARSISRDKAMNIVLAEGFKAIAASGGETTGTSAMKRAPGRAKTMAAGGTN